MADPFSAHAALRDRCPVAHVTDVPAGNPDYYVLSRYDDVFDVLRSPQRWVSRNGHGPGYLRRANSTLAYVDPPEHTRQRRLVQKAFTPSIVAELAPEVAQIAHGLVDRFVDEGRTDLHDAFSYPFPVIVIARLLGVAEELQDTFKRWSDDNLARLASGDPTTYRESAHEFNEYFTEQLEWRRARLTDGSTVGELPNDLLSGMVSAEHEGQSLNTGEMLSMISQLLTAGNETTTSLLNNMVIRLCERPELLARVAADPTLDEAVVEESLRFDSPVLGLWRTPETPVCLHGVDIPQDAKVQVLFASANRDGAVFEEPNEFRVDRADGYRRHLAFGFGPHVCLGAPLARLEGRIGLRVLLDRLPDLRLDGVPLRIPTFFLWGFRTTPVAWSTGSRGGG